MAAGHPLGDLERMPWLHAVGRRLHDSRKQNRGIVVACSALKRRYRDILREHQSDIIVVFLDAPMLVVHERITSREHDYMPPSLLASQFLDLEPLQDDERGMRANVQQSPRKIVGQIAKALASRSLAPLPKADN
jgi:gluconokinase